MFWLIVPVVCAAFLLSWVMFGDDFIDWIERFPKV